MRLKAQSLVGTVQTMDSRKIWLLIRKSLFRAPSSRLSLFIENDAPSVPS